MALVERYNRDFVRAGAQLSEPDKTRMRALNQEQSKLSTDFSEQACSPATKAGALVVDNDLASSTGLSDGRDRGGGRGSEGARARGQMGAAAAEHDAAAGAGGAEEPRASASVCSRRRSLRADRTATATTRAAIIRRMAELRAEQAKLLGYPTWAAYALDNQGRRRPRTRSSC